MEVTIIITALIVCGTAWDITRRFTAHKQHVERLEQLTLIVRKLRHAHHQHMTVSNAAQAELTQELGRCKQAITDFRIELTGPQQDIQTLSGKLDQACAEWREVFATVDAKNDETRKEVLTRVAGLLQAVPRAGFNR